MNERQQVKLDLTRRTLVIGTALLTVALLVLTLVAVTLGPRAPRTELTVQFADTTGLYVGNDVQVIGVRIGEVTAIEPRGNVVDVRIAVDADVPVAHDAGALIMQSSLVTDRFVELSPAWTAGPRLEDGAVIGIERTRSPANYDDITRAVDELLVALKDTSADGTDIGDLLAVGAEQLDGRGAQIADALDAASQALGVVDRNGDAFDQIVTDLDSVVAMLAERDDVLRRVSESVADATGTLAAQRGDIATTLTALRDLSGTTSAFVEDNADLVTADLAAAADVLELLTSRSAEIGEAFDLLPLVAENITRAYDPETRRTRIRLDVRNTGPFSGMARSELCTALALPDICDQLTNTRGTGLFDPLLNLIPEFFPEDL